MCLKLLVAVVFPEILFIPESGSSMRQECSSKRGYGELFALNGVAIFWIFYIVGELNSRLIKTTICSAIVSFFANCFKNFFLISMNN